VKASTNSKNLENTKLSYYYRYPSPLLEVEVMSEAYASIVII